MVCLYDAATKLAQEVVHDLKAFLERSRQANVPWAEARVFETRIRRNIKLAECPSFGKSIFGYAPNCPGAEDYAALANEVAGEVDIGSKPTRLPSGAADCYNPGMIRVSVANPYEQALDFQGLKAAARAVLEGEGVREAEVRLAFVDNAHIHRLNKQFLDHDEPTDVLTFPFTDPGAKKLEGEIVIGYEVARRTPPSAATTSRRSWCCTSSTAACTCAATTTAPTDDAKAMRAKEREYLQALGLPDIAGE